MHANEIAEEAQAVADLYDNDDITVGAEWSEHMGINIIVHTPSVYDGFVELMAEDDVYVSGVEPDGDLIRIRINERGFSPNR